MNERESATNRELKVAVTNAQRVMNISLSGSIIENSNFPNLSLRDIDEINLDLAEVTYINSAGIRRWILWIWNIEKENPNTFLTIFKCPPIMAKQIVSIHEFVPKNSKVKSFFIPYFCEACDQGLEKLFVNEFSDDQLKRVLPELLSTAVNCPKCGKPMELDASPEQYFKLLRI